MVATYIAIPVSVALAAVAGFMYKKLLGFKRQKQNVEFFRDRYGVYMDVAPQKVALINQDIREGVKALAVLMNMSYYACDNFSRHKEQLVENFSELYSNGSLQTLCKNVVYLANIAGNGAFYKLAAEYRLSDIELETCCFIYFGFRWQETCTAVSITENAYNVRCSRIRKKFGMDKDDRIPDFLENWCRNSNTNSSVQ